MEKIISIKSLIVSEVLNSFDIKQIYEHMKKVNWTWAIPYERDLRVPTESEIFHEALDLLYTVKCSLTPVDVYWLSTGGLRAYKDNKTLEIWIEFNCEK